MLLVYSSPNSLMTGHIKNLLEAENIPCIVKNEFLSGAAGELPPTEAWPEIWVKEQRDYGRAKQIVEQAMKEQHAPDKSWLCPCCGEKLEGQFTDCWKCGCSR